MLRSKMLRVVWLGSVVLLVLFVAVGRGSEARSNSSMKPVTPPKGVAPFSDSKGMPMGLPEAMKGHVSPGMLPPGMPEMMPMGNAPSAAGCLVKVVSDSEVLQINASVLNALLNSPFAKKECRADIERSV